jgi:hypothetical protein
MSASAELIDFIATDGTVVLSYYTYVDKKSKQYGLRAYPFRVANNHEKRGN